MGMARMTVDHHTHDEKIVHGSLFPTLTLVFAGMTILFAVFSIVTGSRLSALHVDQLKAVEKSSTLEAASIEQMQTTLKSAQADFKDAKKEAQAEKKKVDQLTRKLSAAQKELTKIKSDLDAAHQTISEFKTTPSVPSTIQENDAPAAQTPSQKPDQPSASTLPGQPSSASEPVPDNHSSELSSPAPPATMVDKKAAPAVNETADTPAPQPSVPTKDHQ
jgi:hypothetical protein